MAVSGEYLARIKLALEGKEAVVSGLTQVEQTAKRLTKTTVTTIFDKQGIVTGTKIAETFKNMGDATAKTSTKMGDFEKSMRRVLIVAPVWMAFRTIIQGFFAGLSAGTKYWEELDVALVKTQLLLEATGKDFSGVMSKLKTDIQSLAIETGTSMVKITNAFNTFIKSGLDVGKSWEATVATTKFAETTFTDVTVVSKSMALAFKLLGKSIDESIPLGQKFDVELGKMFKLIQTNVVESDQLVESFRNFLPTASAYNISLDQTIALLATLDSAGLQATRAGTALRTSFSKLIEDSGKLAATLGIYVNPEVDNTFTVFMKVLGAVKQLGTSGLPVQAGEAIKAIFGGTRTAEAVKVLITLYDELQKNLGVTTSKYKDLGTTMGDYNAANKEVTDSASHQLGIFRELRTQVFEQFISGVAGADDYAKALKNINTIFTGLGMEAKRVGDFLNSVFLDSEAPLLLRITGLNALIKGLKNSQKEYVDMMNKVEEGIHGKLPLSDVTELIGQLSVRPKAEGSYKPFIDQLQQEALFLAKNLGIQKETHTYVQQTIVDSIKQAAENQKQVSQYDNLLRLAQLKRKESLSDLEIIRMQNTGYSASEIELAKLRQHVEKMVEQYNSLDKVVSGDIPKLSTQRILTDVLNDNYKKILDSANGNSIIEAELVKLAGERNTYESLILQTQYKQRDAVRSQYMAYEQADMAERTRLRRLMELQMMTASEIAQRFDNDVFDKSIIEKYWSSFSDEAKSAVDDVIQRMYNLPSLTVNAGLGAKRSIAGITGATATPQLAPIYQQNANFGNININLPEDSLDKLTQKAGEQLTKKLQNDEDFKKLVANAIRSYV